MRCCYPLSLSLALLLTAGCVPAPPPEPAALPRPAAVPLPPPPLVPPPMLAGDWRDWPLTPGTWVYRQDARGSIALFGTSGADAAVTLRCDRAAGRIFLSRKGASSGTRPFVLRTTSTVRSAASQSTGGTPAYMAIALHPSDRLLDAIAYSRGRFVLEAGDMAPLVVPAWAEIARVIEDCRDDASGTATGR